MSKKAGRNKTSWRTKTMAALALSAAFGLSAGPALAENVTDLSWNPHDATPNAGKIITGDDFTITGTVGAAGNIEMTGGTLTVGDLIFNASGIVAPGAGDLSFGSGEKLIFKGGKIVADTITIGGTAWNVLDLSQGGFANQANATNLTLRIGGNASTAPNSISTQKLDYYATPGMLLQNTTIELTGTGVLNWIPSDFNVEVPSGYNGGSTLQAYEDIDPSPTVDLKNLHSRLVMTGGTLNMDASQMDGYGRLIELSSVDISSGTVNIGGYYTTTVTDFNDDYNPSTPATTKANAKFSSVLYGRISAVDDMFRIRGNAEINLHDYGNIGTFYSTTGGTPFVMSIEGGTINMLGGQTSASLIRASSAFTDRAGASAASNAKLSISGGEIKVADGNYGAILSRDTNMSGGTITVGGTLMVAGGMNWRYNADVFEDIAALNTYDTMNTTALQWGDFKFNGGTISIASTGIVDFATGNVDFYAQGGTFGGKLTLTDTVPGSPTDAQKGILYAKTVIVNPNKTFTVSDLSITDTDSTITVNGRLIVTGDVITAGTDVNIGSNLSIAQGGTLVAQLDKVLERANESASWTLQGNNSTLADALTGSTGLINFLSATGYNYTKNQKAQIASDLGLETGQLIFENGTLTDGDTSAVTDGSAEVDVDNVVTDTNTELVIDTTASSSATDVTLTSTGGDVPLQSKTITIDSTAVDTVNIETTVILSGAGTGENTPLVADGNGDAIETLSVDGGAIQLGVAGSSAAQGGTVGNIEFTGTGGTLSVDDGTFNAGAISTDGTIAGAVDIAVASTPGATSTLTTDGIDLDTTGGVKIDLSSAVLNNTTGGIKVGGDTSTAATSHELILTNAAVDNGSGSIVFGNTTSSGDNKLTMDAGSILETGAITFGTVTRSLLGNILNGWV